LKITQLDLRVFLRWSSGHADESAVRGSVA
ncbi:MAG: hypothetical protein ACI841_005001, partial [Planctomycetota bacterium]